MPALSLRSKRHLAPGAVLIALALFFSGGIAAHAETTDPGDGNITWAVTPASETAPDRRGVIEHELDPGESVTDHFAVRNLSAQTVTFKLSAADGYYTANGRFNMLSADQESVDAGTWVEMPESVTVGPRETAIVTFTATVPEDAEPGDHAAGIAASVMSAGTNEQGSQIGVESRVGFRMMTRVSGDLVTASTLAIGDAGYTLSWNPIRPGSVDVTFDVTNEGNTRVIARGVVNAGFASVSFPQGEEARQQLLPGESREITVTVDDVWPLFFVPTSVVLDPDATDRSGEAVEADEVSASTVVWAIPLPQLLWLAGIALVVLALFWGRARSKKKTAALVQEAVERGRLEAQQRSEAAPFQTEQTTPTRRSRPSDAGATVPAAGAGHQVREDQ